MAQSATLLKSAGSRLRAINRRSQIFAAITALQREAAGRG
jgi:hypothetical protein